jgi:transcriptional regulator with XRE-family HTH domain
MAGKEMQMGPMSRTVAANVKRLRDGKNWNFKELSEQVKQVANWDISAVAVRRIEDEERRVSPDDLAALALALGVSPMALMLPTEASQIVPDGEVYTAKTIWDWAAGNRAIMGDQLDFIRASNPLDWPQMAALIEHLDVGGNRDLAAGLLWSRGAVGEYEPPPEINAEDLSEEDVAEIMRDVKDGPSRHEKEIADIVRGIRASRGDS